MGPTLQVLFKALATRALRTSGYIRTHPIPRRFPGWRQEAQWVRRPDDRAPIFLRNISKRCLGPNRRRRSGIFINV